MHRLGQILIAVSLVALTGLAAQDSKLPPKVTTKRTIVNDASITTVTLEPVLIQRDEATKSYTMLSAWVAYADHSWRPKLFALSFHSRSPECRFSDKSGLVLSADNNEITLTNGTDRSGEGGLWVFGEREGALCNESCSVFLSEKTFRRLANSKRVEARLGSRTLLLDDVALNAVRYFAGRIP
jgi:hypothetical protein